MTGCGRARIPRTIVIYSNAEHRPLAVHRDFDDAALALGCNAMVNSISTRGCSRKFGTNVSMTSGLVLKRTWRRSENLIC